MHGARTVMTSNGFIRTISVIIVLFSLRIYDWIMNTDLHIVEFHFYLYRNQTFHWIAFEQDHIVLCCSTVV